MRNETLKELLSFVSRDGTVPLNALAERYGGFRGVTEADMDGIADTLGGDFRSAFYIKLCAALVSRRGCDRFKFGKRHSDAEILEYLKYLFFGLADETVYLLSIDSSGRTLSCDRVGEGTVNISNVLPRKMLDVAKKRGAARVVLAHNHPGGYAKASEDDVSTTAILSELLRSSGIELSAHYVVSGAECARIEGV